MRADPFTGYSTILRVIAYGLIPVFTIWQFFRLRRGLHVFQLEGYKRQRFLVWVRRERARALFLTRDTHKKPLVMTGRAWRLLVTSTFFSFAFVAVPTGVVHISVGWPADIPTWAGATALAFVGIARLLIAADLVLAPVQGSINRKFLDAATARLDEVSPLVVGITGSFGKTSTKSAIERLIAAPDKVLATPASFNTPLGISRTVNESLQLRHEYLLVEMGAYGVGEIAELCRLARPSIGVLTAIGPAHLERFGSIEAIEQAKYELIEALPPQGTAIMNVDDPAVRRRADSTEHVAVVRFGIEAGGAPDVTANRIETTSKGTVFTVSAPRWSKRSMRVITRLLGRHAINNVLAGIAVALAVGRDLTELKRPIESLEPVEHRLQIIEGSGGVTVIDDAYNSNPRGAAAAFEVLADMSGRRKVVVTPGMVELGPLQFEANETFGEQAAIAAEVVVVVGKLNRDAIIAGAHRAATDTKVVPVDSLAKAQEVLKDLLRRGDVVLFENDLPDQYEG